jgi:hypothetical protein
MGAKKSLTDDAVLANETLKPGDFAIILAQPWDEFIWTQPYNIHEQLRDMVWWGYKVLRVDHKGVQIESQTAPKAIRRTVPMHCLRRCEKRKEAPVAPKQIPNPYPSGAKVRYLNNFYIIESIERDTDGMPLYNLKSLDRDKLVWSGDRVWHSLIVIAR